MLGPRRRLQFFLQFCQFFFLDLVLLDKLNNNVRELRVRWLERTPSIVV